MDREHFFTMMPKEFEKMTMTVACNDCNFKTRGPFHVMKVKCIKCRSWNTSEIQGEPDEVTEEILE
jgi:DNA-directed RNA polymerase subunit RPC12/RpoP